MIKRTNFISKVVPVGLDFLVSKGTTIFTMPIFEISGKATFVKNY